MDLETCTLDMEHMRSLITERTKLVAVGYASNLSGTVNDVRTIVQWAQEVGALSFVDAVQYAPHGLIDVKELECDFLACSSYKFFGPHVGVLYGKPEHLARLTAYKVRPAEDTPPDKWETGTKNHEGLAGMTAAVDYLADLGSLYGGAMFSAPRRAKLIAAWTEIDRYEQMLIERLIGGLQAMKRVRIYGITNRADLAAARWRRFPSARRARPRRSWPRHWPPRMSLRGTAISMRWGSARRWAWKKAAACCGWGWSTTIRWTRSTAVCWRWTRCKESLRINYGDNRG